LKTERQIKDRSKKKRIIQKPRPRNVWNSLRKLEIYLKKADIQANIFMESLNELRDILSFEFKADFVKKLCNSINGDLLSALWNHIKSIEEKQITDGEKKEADIILLGVFDALKKSLDLSPFKIEGEKFSVTRETAKNYDFDEIPDSLANERVQKFEVEVLRCGWKIGDKVIQKPKVFGKYLGVIH